MNNCPNKNTVEKVSCMKKLWHENLTHKGFLCHAWNFLIFMQENEIFMQENENFAPGMISLPPKLAYFVELYTTS